MKTTNGVCMTIKKKIVLGSAIAAAPAPTRDYWHLMTRVCPARAA